MLTGMVTNISLIGVRTYNADRPFLFLHSFIALSQQNVRVDNLHSRSLFSQSWATKTIELRISLGSTEESAGWGEIQGMLWTHVPCSNTLACLVTKPAQSMYICTLQTMQ